MNKFFQMVDWSAVGASILAFFTSFFAPIAPFLVLVLVLVAADLFTGINAAKLRGEPIRSFGIRRTIGKILMYWTVIICSEVMVLTSRLIMQDPEMSVINLRFLTHLVVVLIAYAEYQSIIENVDRGTGLRIWKRIKSFFGDDNKKD